MNLIKNAESIEIIEEKNIPKVELKPMLNDSIKESLIKQQYRIVGHHSGVKVCGWTKNMLKGEGGCYKLKFYGINSLQCLQMTTSFSCANRCIFCWRDYKAPVSTEWEWTVDSPDFIFNESIHAQEKLLEGFKGNPKVDPRAYETSRHVKHAALSLNGEPINYPFFNEYLEKLNQEGISTFVVTNGQYPDKIEHMVPVTQLYISMDAPNKQLMKEVGKPLFPNYWERFNKSLDAMAKKKERTAIRITMIKGINDVEPENYAKQIKQADADFVEVKGYMHIGASQERLSRDSMPTNIEIYNFTREILQHIKEDYEIVSEHLPSRVILLTKKKFKQINEDGSVDWNIWIDFKKWDEAVKSGKKNIPFEDYSKPIPRQFIGVKINTLTEMSENKEQHLKEIKTIIDEEKPEYYSVCETGWEGDLE